MSVRERLQAFCKRLGLTLTQVSEKTGIGTSSVSEFENGKREPSSAAREAGDGLPRPGRLLLWGGRTRRGEGPVAAQAGIAFCGGD